MKEGGIGKEQDLGTLHMFPRKLFAVLCIVFFVVAVFSAASRFVVAGPPSSGDWIVTGIESYSDQTIVLDGNLVIENGGNLTFKKVTFELKCHFDGEYNISVYPGGKFYVLDGSVITSHIPSNAYSFLVQSNSTFRMSDSELHSSGWLIPTVEEHMGLIINSDDAVVENCLISNNGHSIFTNGDGVVIRNNNITENYEGVRIGGEASIYNNYISKNGAGIHICGACSPSVYDNTIEYNLGSGIGIADGTPIIRNNNIFKNGEGGIHSYSRANPMILDNTIASNNNSGITVRDHSTGTIQGNIIENNPIIISQESNPTLRANYIASSGGPGVFFTERSSGFVEGNIVTNNTIGINVGGYSNPTIRGNIITANYEGIQCSYDSKPEIHWNDIYRNTGYGVNNNAPSVTVNATHNYWGSANGPVQGPKDQVDPEEVSGNVLYNPWLTESIAPSIQITSPLSGGIVSSTTKVSAEFDAPNGADKVEFYIDDQWKHADVSAPYEWNWNTTQCSETTHKIAVEVYDMFGLKAFTFIAVFVDNTPPTVSIEEPAPNNTYCGVIRVSANATDNKEIDKAQVTVDNIGWLEMTYDSVSLLWKYDLNTIPFSDGQHTLTVKALDKANNLATTNIAIITENTPPTLTIQTPQSGITVGLTLIVRVEVNDQSNISRVEFYLGNTLVHNPDVPSGTKLYQGQWAWDTTKYPNGPHTITVKAYDTIGNFKTKDIPVTVNNVEVPWLQANLLTIVQVAIGLGGLVFAIVTYWSRTKDKRKKKKTTKRKETTNVPPKENPSRQN